MKSFSLGIKGKFVVVAALIVAISSITWGSWAWRNEKRLLFDGLVSNARSLATSFQTPIINALVYEEMGIIEEGGLLDNFVEEIVANKDFQITYAFVTDEKGKVLAHSRYTDYGTVYSDELTKQALQGSTFLSKVVLEPTTHEHLLDVAMPLRIHGKSWGSLRIGISMKALERELNLMGMKVFAFSALIFVAATTLFYLVGHTTAKPIQNLAAAMSALDLKTLAVDLPEPRNDEIGILQKDFSAMLERLRKSENERQQFFSSLAQSEKLAVIGKLVAGVAHEVNNPLTAISSCIYYLEFEDSDKVRQQTAVLRQGIARIQTIVDQLANFSRAGNLELAPVPSSAFFQEAKTFGAMALKKSPIAFEAIDRCSPPIVVMMDKGKMHQVVLNLLMNAADACGAEGIVSLVASTDEAGYTITVTDSGEGIPDEVRKHLFEVFYTTKPAGKGTGMGLAICKNIVDMHNGIIDVSSKPGKTVFSVRIPIANEGASS